MREAVSGSQAVQRKADANTRICPARTLEKQQVRGRRGSEYSNEQRSRTQAADIMILGCIAASSHTKEEDVPVADMAVGMVSSCC